MTKKSIIPFIDLRSIVLRYIVKIVQKGKIVTSTNDVWNYVRREIYKSTGKKVKSNYVYSHMKANKHGIWDEFLKTESPVKKNSVDNKECVGILSIQVQGDIFGKNTESDAFGKGIIKMSCNKELRYKEDAIKNVCLLRAATLPRYKDNKERDKLTRGMKTRVTVASYQELTQGCRHCRRW
jgi:hypothetical protein